MNQTGAIGRGRKPTIGNRKRHTKRKMKRGSG
nr:MAG TPA: hypothetical protein [Caudoviricetes sp.]